MSVDPDVDFIEDEEDAQPLEPNEAAKVVLEGRGYTTEDFKTPRAISRNPYYRITAPEGLVVGVIPAYGFPSLVVELDQDWIVHDGWLGITSADGHYVEFLLSRMPRRLLSNREGYVSPRETCASIRNGTHLSSFTTVYGIDAAFTDSDRVFARAVVYVHLGSGAGDCIEISAPSARLFAAYAEHCDVLELTAPASLSSIKIYLRETGSVESATSKARNLANTFMFELAAMRRLSMSLHEPLGQRKRVPPTRRPQTHDREPRFPPQTVDARAASLFMSATQATGYLSGPRR